MKYATLAVFVIALALMTGCGKPGRYQLFSNGKGGVYKIDTQTGQVWLSLGDYNAFSKVVHNIPD